MNLNLQYICDDSDAPAKKGARLIQSYALQPVVQMSAESEVIKSSYHMSASKPSCS